MQHVLVLTCSVLVIAGTLLFVGACMAIIEAGRHPVD